MKKTENTTIRRYLPEATIILVFLLLVIVRMSSTQRFRPGAEKNAVPALNHTNILNEVQIANLETPPLRIYLDTVPPATAGTKNAVMVTGKELTQPALIHRLKHAGAPMIIISPSRSLAARTWMILAQSGIKKLYVYGDPDNIEHFPYIFPPNSGLHGE